LRQTTCACAPSPPPQALYKSLTKDDQLPVSSSVLWAQHMQPCRPPGSVLDIKKSSYKKLSKFLAALAKEGLLQASASAGGGGAGDAPGRLGGAVESWAAA
jgi:hypothetical protein